MFGPYINRPIFYFIHFPIPHSITILLSIKCWDRFCLQERAYEAYKKLLPISFFYFVFFFCHTNPYIFSLIEVFYEKQVNQQHVSPTYDATLCISLKIIGIMWRVPRKQNLKYSCTHVAETWLGGGKARYCFQESTKCCFMLLVLEDKKRTSHCLNTLMFKSFPRRLYIIQYSM